MQQPRIAVVGDFNPNEIAHRAIEKCFELQNVPVAQALAHDWVGTASLMPHSTQPLSSFSGVWLAPASPYASTDGALWAVQFARTRSVPFLGTCGGFQHAILESVRNLLGLNQAGHTELEPDTSMPLVHRMACSLVEKSQVVSIVPGARFARMFNAESSLEQFHCNFGLNPIYEPLLAKSSLQVAARSEDGQVRAIERPDHPFFIGTLFQPERKALTGALHPIVSEFFAVCRAQAGRVT